MSYLDNDMLIEKKKMINNLQNEIDKLQDKKINIEIVNFKIKILRKIKIGLCTGRRVFPYVLVAGLLFGGFSSLGSTPIIKDNSKRYLSTRKTYDSNGNYGVESKYEKYDKPIGTLTFYDKWSLDNNGFYYRDVNVYDITKIDEDYLLSILDNLEQFDINKAIGTPSSSVKEKKNNVSLEDNKAFWQVIVYNEDKEDFVYLIESNAQNVTTSIAWACLSFLVSFIPFEFRSNHSNYSYKGRINEIKANNPYLDSEDLERKIKIKKANYDRLVKKDV